MITRSRQSAFNVLLRCDKTGAYSNIALSNELERAGLSAPDRALASEIVYGTISRRITLDYCIAKFSSKPIEKLSREIRVILEMAFYQLMYLGSAVPHAVCNEAVMLADKALYKGAGGYVNAVVRAFLRADKKVEMPTTDTAYGLSINYSVSKDIAKLLKDSFGVEVTQKMLESTFAKPYTYLSVNTLKTTAKALADKIDGTAVTDSTVKIDGGNVTLLDGFNEGEFFVQDIASATAIEMLSPRENDNVIDMCSAPGGKSLKAAVMMKNRGSIYSFDLHENKLSLINSSADRLGIDIIHTECKDGTVADNALLGYADKIICDVPCSGLGVMAKKPEIRYKSLKEIEGLYDTQKKILETAASYLKKGGRLLYSTCTINPYENRAQVEAFLENNKHFSLAEEKLLLPTADNDGFYMAVLVND